MPGGHPKRQWQSSNAAARKTVALAASVVQIHPGARRLSWCNGRHGGFRTRRKQVRLLPRARTGMGFRVSLAASGLPYDLIIDRCGEIQRVQVKSTTAVPTASGTVVAKLSRLTPSGGAGTNRHAQCYEPTDLDLFFVLTGEGHVFLIPLRDVAGVQSLMVGPGSPYYVQTIGLSGR